MSAARFEPRIIGFLCNWCSYAGADRAGAAQVPCPPNVSIVRVMCSGRVDPQFVLAAFRAGADGVLILGCHPGDCHYKEGNYRAAARHALLLRLLAQVGIAGERCRFDSVSASEGERFVRIIEEMVSAVRSLGPFIKPGQRQAAGSQAEADEHRSPESIVSTSLSVRRGVASSTGELIEFEGGNVDGTQ